MLRANTQRASTRIDEIDSNIAHRAQKNRAKHRITLVSKKNQATICLQQVHRRQNVVNKRLLNLNLEMVVIIEGVRHGKSKEETRGEETRRQEETCSKEE